MGKEDQTFQAGYCLRQGGGAANTRQEDIGRYPDLSARDWQLLVELELKFPNHIAVTTLRSDIILISESTKQVVLLELSMPCEEFLEAAFKRKLAKHSGLASSCKQAGWRARCFPVEVGCRSFADVSKMCPEAESSRGIN